MNSNDRSLTLPASFTHRVRIEALMPADSPRLNGVDESHVRRLTDIYTTLPPILVHRGTMRVVDGMHRVAAAAANGLTSVEVQYFDGADEEAFLRSVTANIAHGLPLSVADRKAAAERILRSRSDLSDRAVAAYTGLDAKTVATLRPCSTADSPQSNIRVGADGRAHPLDRTAERIRAAELMTRRPDLPLRAIVKETGLSLGTAHDVRQRLLRGEAPVPTGRRAPARREAAETGDRPEPLAAPSAAGNGAPAADGGPSGSNRTRGSLETLRRLAGDPSLRHSESGRQFLRWLHTHFIVDEAWRQQADAVPPHCTGTVAELALQCAGAWKRFAEDLDRRRLTHTTPAPSRHAAPESRQGA
ncbi:Chromosome segregation protein Spo0J, contains ParB-like nuclease domain [Streptomyces sp. 2231.1]|uniref:ParB/RepB/Spo0J family partition protein n=1 Tax=Streptomyces sp. 2231.1 TaxID=1855347 RepID=UPI000898822B|nr:transcriptional regulator [Streptomyces sp. 2231.1]SEE68149.1 Chromosome segregation protein Spo0J, contains ParB-like nuclease domain [Streptomyces sp. 2231.1]